MLLSNILGPYTGGENYSYEMKFIWFGADFRMRNRNNSQVGLFREFSRKILNFFVRLCNGSFYGYNVRSVVVRILEPKRNSEAQS